MEKNERQDNISELLCNQKQIVVSTVQTRLSDRENENCLISFTLEIPGLMWFPSFLPVPILEAQSYSGCIFEAGGPQGQARPDLRDLETPSCALTFRTLSA